MLASNGSNRRRPAAIAAATTAPTAAGATPPSPNAPNAQYPTQNEQAYASLLYAVEHARELRVDPSRVAITGESVGGNMAAVLTLMAKERRGPRIRFQVLLYPVTDYRTNASYRKFADGPRLTARTMQWMFDLQGYKGDEGSAAFPLRATTVGGVDTLHA